MSISVNDLALATGLPGTTSPEDLLKHVTFLKKASDFHHLLDSESLKDCIINIRIPLDDGQLPQPKRARTRSGPASAPSGSAPTITKTMRAHSLILSAKSKYFKVLMEGQWLESQDKPLEVNLPSEGAFEAFQLLVELSYGVIYTRRPGDGPTFPHDTLMALILVADMFEFTHCIEQCCDEMGHSLTADDALHIIDSLQHLGSSHESINHLLDRAVEALGPIESLWTQGAFCDGPNQAVGSVSTDKIKAITSIDMLIFLLKSDHLQMKSENTTFTLVHWWLQQQDRWSEMEKQMAFNKIMESKALRFYNIDLFYLTAYAMRTPWLEGSGRGFHIIQDALLTKEMGRKGAWCLPESRSISTVFELNARLTTATLDSWQDSIHNYCFVGIAAGLPIVMAGTKFEGKTADDPRLTLAIGWSSGGLPERDIHGYDILYQIGMRSTAAILPRGRSRTKEERCVAENDCRIDFVCYEGVGGADSPWFDYDGNMTIKIFMSQISGAGRQ